MSDGIKERAKLAIYLLRNGNCGVLCDECYPLLRKLRCVLAKHHQRELRLFMDGTNA